MYTCVCVSMFVSATREAGRQAGKKTTATRALHVYVCIFTNAALSLTKKKRKKDFHAHVLSV